MARKFTCKSTHNNAGIAAGFLRVRRDRELKDWDQVLAFVSEFGDGANVSDGTDKVKVHVRSRGEKGHPTSIAVRLYNTDIVTYYSDWTAECDNGGFDTPTTFSRLNQFGPRGYWFNHGGRKLYRFGMGVSGERGRCEKGVRFPVGPKEEK